jgi:hypothetical protein
MIDQGCILFALENTVFEYSSLHSSLEEYSIRIQYSIFFINEMHRILYSNTDRVLKSIKEYPHLRGAAAKFGEIWGISVAKYQTTAC